MHNHLLYFLFLQGISGWKLWTMTCLPDRVEVILAIASNYSVEVISAIASNYRCVRTAIYIDH